MSVVGNSDFHFPSRKKWDYDYTLMWFANKKKISEVSKDVREGKKKKSIPEEKKKNMSSWSAIAPSAPSPKMDMSRKPISFADPFVTSLEDEPKRRNSQDLTDQYKQSREDRQDQFRERTRQERDQNRDYQEKRTEDFRQNRQTRPDGFRQENREARPDGFRQENRQNRPDGFRQENRDFRQEHNRQEDQKQGSRLSEFTRMSPSDFRTRGLFAHAYDSDPKPNQQSNQSGQQPAQGQQKQNQAPRPRSGFAMGAGGRRELSADDQMILRQAKRDRAKGLDVPEYDGTNFEEVYAAVQMVRTDNYMFLFTEEKKNKIKAKVGAAVAIASAFSAPVDGILEDTQNVLASHEQVFENQFYLAGMPQPSSSDVEIWKAIGTVSLIRFLDNIAERKKHERQTSSNNGGETIYPTRNTSGDNYTPMPEGGKGAIGKLLNVAQTFLGGGNHATSQPSATSGPTGPSGPTVNSQTTKSPIYTTTTSVPSNNSQSTPTVSGLKSTHKKYDGSWMNDFAIPWATPQPHQPSPVSVSIGTPVVVPPEQKEKKRPPLVQIPQAPQVVPPQQKAPVMTPHVQTPVKPVPAPVQEPIENDLDMLQPPPSLEEQVKLAGDDDETKSTL